VPRGFETVADKSDAADWKNLEYKVVFPPPDIPVRFLISEYRTPGRG